MNIYWTSSGGPDPVWWIARGNDKTLFSVCKRNDKSINHSSGGGQPPATRWCVFNEDNTDGYCGDVPLDLDEESMKAMAIVVWRLRDKA
jgi:hypothetical protein